jgi:flagellar M-ring protein FliF
MASPTSQFIDLWRRLTLGQRASVVGAVLVTLALVGGIIVYGSQPDYAVLFSDLKTADAQAIVEKLKTAQVPYQLSSGGTTVSVPSEQVTELRLQMASSGTLSAGHVGFDIFDKTSFGATDFTQQVNYQRAIEGELARTLEGMKEVQSARVHITRSRESVFAEKAEPAKASVMLGLRGKELSAERTEAIVSLVSSAVEGLTPENVSVMDNEGRLLTSPHDKGGIKGVGASDSVMEARRAFEAESAGQIVAMLEPVTGPGHVRANVTADIDFNQVEQMEETFDPKSAVIRSQQTTQEFRNSPGATGGVTGTRANDPGAPAAQTATNGSGNGRSATTTTYEISKVTKRTVGNGGRVTRMSVSVLLDSGPATEGLNTPEGLKKVQELVSSAVGIDAARGDQVTVHMIAFQQPAPVEAVPVSWFERNRDLVKTGIKYGVLALVALLLIVVVIRPARRALKQAAKSQEQLLLAAATPLSLPASHLGEEQAAESPRTVAEIQAHTAPQTVAEMQAKAVEVERKPSLIAIPRAKDTGANVIKDQIIEYSKEEPQKVAMAVRNWLQGR